MGAISSRFWKRSKQKSTLITVDHNKPDLVLTDMSSALFNIWRLRMVIEAKPAKEWGTVSEELSRWLGSERISKTKGYLLARLARMSSA